MNRRQFLKRTGVVGTAAAGGVAAGSLWEQSDAQTDGEKPSREELIVTQARNFGVRAIESVYEADALVFDVTYQTRADSMPAARSDLVGVALAFANYQATYDDDVLAVLPLNGPIFRASIYGDDARAFLNDDLSLPEYASRVFDTIVESSRGSA